MITVDYYFVSLSSLRVLKFGSEILGLLNKLLCRSQWPRGLRRRSADARLLRSWVQILPDVWMFVCCECCVLSGRGLCDELITRPEESYRLWCVVMCVIQKPQELEGHGSRWAAAPQENKSYNKVYILFRQINKNILNAVNHGHF